MKALKPSSGIIGTVIGVIGLLFAIYTYQDTKQFKSLSFVVNPKPTLILSTNHLNASKLTILDENGNVISGDIYSVEGYIWNSGTLTISGGDIIVPLQVVISEAVNLLYFRTIYASRQEVTDITVTRAASERNLNVSFRTLEPEEGIKILFIYQGDNNFSITMDGAITGIKQIRDSKQIAKDKKWIAPWKGYIWLAIIFMVIAMSFAFIIVVTEWLPNIIRKLFPKSGQRFISTLNGTFAFLLVFILFGMIIYLLVRPWIAPEKSIEDKIVDFIPDEISSG